MLIWHGSKIHYYICFDSDDLPISAIHFMSLICWLWNCFHYLLAVVDYLFISLNQASIFTLLATKILFILYSVYMFEFSDWMLRFLVVWPNNSYLEGHFLVNFLSRATPICKFLAKSWWAFLEARELFTGCSKTTLEQDQIYLKFSAICQFAFLLIILIEEVRTILFLIYAKH